MPRLSQKFTRTLALTTLAACSLLIVLTAALESRSYSHPETFGAENRRYMLTLSTHSGNFYLALTKIHDRVFISPPSNSTIWQIQYLPSNDVPEWNLFSQQTPPEYPPYPWAHDDPPPALGIIYLANTQAPSNTFHPIGYALAIPASLLEFLLAITALLAFLLYRKNRHPKSHCQSCGYNLSGNPSTPACPECGHPLNPPLSPNVNQ